MTVQFSLIELLGASATMGMERYIGRRVELAATPDALVRRYGQALGVILTELSTQIAAPVSAQ
jgi:hypothetical protein